VLTGHQDAWKRVGDQLVERRVQLDPRYRVRRVFARETCSGTSEDSWYRQITDLESGARDNYTRSTVAAAEAAYQLRPGSIRRLLDEGLDLEPAAPPTRGGLPDVPSRYDDPVLQHLWETPDPTLTDDQRRAIIQVYRAIKRTADRGVGGAQGSLRAHRTGL
jgi:hypothetical protein